MGRDETLNSLRRVLDGEANRQRPFRQPRTQGFAFQQFRNDVRPPVVGTHVINGNDVGMIQRRRSARFQFKPARLTGAPVKFGLMRFKATSPPQGLVARPENLAHGSSPDFLEDSVVTYSSVIHGAGASKRMLGGHVHGSQQQNERISAAPRLESLPSVRPSVYYQVSAATGGAMSCYNFDSPQIYRGSL